jgi:hypothetical protein
MYHVIAVRDAAFPHYLVRDPPVQRVQYQVAGLAGVPVGKVEVLTQGYVRALVHAPSVPTTPIKCLVMSSLFPE